MKNHPLGKPLPRLLRTTYSERPSKRTCATCNRLHHSSLHDEKPTTSSSSQKLSFPSSQHSSRTHNSLNRQQQRFTNSLLLYLPVTLITGNKYISTNNFLGNGSNDSYLTKSTIDYLQIEQSQTTFVLFNRTHSTASAESAITFANSHFPTFITIRSHFSLEQTASTLLRPPRAIEADRGWTIGGSTAAC